MKRGVFWVVEGELLAFPFREEDTVGVAKSGNTYNHRLLWDHVKPRHCNKPYNYYPRGRVEITPGGKAVIYLSPVIGSEWLSKIKAAFEIEGELVIRVDGSIHYRSHLT